MQNPFLGAAGLRNWGQRVANPAGIDAVLLSHAHFDHIGYLPLLVRQGFRGPVYCTPATADLARVLLPDSAQVAGDGVSVSLKQPA